MTDLVDLMHGQEEVRFCSALAILLQYDEESSPILRGVLEKVAESWEHSDPCPFSKGVEVERVRVSVEEPVQGDGDREGRYDLVIRFSHVIDEGSPSPYVLIVEAKVAAEGAHGDQFSTYREGIEWIRDRQETQGTPVFGLLTMNPEKVLRGLKERDKRLVRFHVGWEEIANVVMENMPKGSACGALKDSFCAAVKRWTVKLEDYTSLLERDSFPFPVVMDALDLICERLRSVCDAAKKMRDPVGAEGPVWIPKNDKGGGEKHDGCYRYGHWWRVGKDWAGLTLAWHYREKADPLPPSAHKGPGGEAYVPYLELWTAKTGAEKPAKLWPQSEIVKLLSEEAVEKLGKWLLEGEGASQAPPLGLREFGGGD